MPAQRRRPWPPTRYGYLPPDDAIATSWICSDWDCGKGGPDFPGERWPRRCPECRKPIVTHHLEEPWAHAAERVELDVRLSAGPTSDDWTRAQCEDRVWHIEEALLNKDAATAETRRRELDALVLDATAREGYFRGGSLRLSVIFAALEHQAWDLAMAEIRDWRATAVLDDLATNHDQNIYARQLVQAMLLLMEDDRAAQFTYRSELWEIMRELKPTLGNELSISQDEAYARLGRVMSSLGNAREEAVIATLQQLREIDLEQGLFGEVLPLSVPTRMSILGRRELLRWESGIDSSFIWSVCLSPFMFYAKHNPGRLSRDLADIVSASGNWAIVGASRCLQEFVREGEEDDAYWAVLDRALDIMLATNLTSSLSYRERVRLQARETHSSQDP